MKKNKVPLHTLLSQNLLSVNVLYKCLDIEQKWKLRVPSKFLLVLENLFISKVTIGNLDVICNLINEAIKLVEDKLLETQSIRMTNDRISEELTNAKSKILELKNELLKVSSEPQKVDVVKTEIYKVLEQKNNNLQKEIEQKNLSFGKEIILMRDNLCMKEEMLKTEDGYQETNAWKLIQASYRETEAILKRMGILVVNESGTFDSNIQLVTDTISTDMEELHDTVAHTFREGYRTADKIIRPQEVVLYSYIK